MAGEKGNDSQLARENERLRRRVEELQEHTRRILYSIGDAVIFTDAEGLVRVMNQVAEKLTGWTEAEAMGQPIDRVFRIFNKRSHQPLECPVYRVLREGVAVSLTNHTVLMCRDKTERPIADSCAPFHDAHDDIQGSILVFRDQTRERKAQKALHASMVRKNALLNGIPDIIMEVDTAKVYTWANEAGKRFFGDDVIGKEAAFFFEGEQRTYDLVGPLFAGSDQTIYVESWQRRKDQEKRLLAWWCRVLKDQTGNVIGALSTARDITEMKRAEEKLRESEEKFKYVFDHSAVGKSLTLLSGEITCNDALAKMLGYSKAELTSLRWQDLTHPEDIEATQREIDRMTSRQRVSSRFTKRYLRKDSGVVWADVSTFLRWSSDGRPLYFITTVLDITASKQAEAEKERLVEHLHHTQKMEAIGTLAGGVAHDYNNMLSVISGYAELALGKVDPGDPLHGDLKQIREAARRSIDITRQLVAFARKQPIAPKVIDLNDTVEGMLKMLRRLIGENIDLAWLPDMGLWQVKMDPAQIDQILANLCVNARDAISATGKITIETDNANLDEAYCTDHAGFIPGKFVLLAVSDDGCGMDDKTKAKIFEPFFTTKGIGKGTGLGLATVYGIVKQNNGFIDVYSEPGQGTTFKIYLPRHAGQAENTATESIEQIPAGRGETVLIVEDEPAIIIMVKKMLERLEYQVLTAGKPREAIRLARERAGRIHLLLTDVIMPEMNGRELANELQALHPDIKTLFMSGYTSNLIARQGVLAAGVNFIEKPLSQKELALKIRAIIDNVKT